MNWTMSEGSADVAGAGWPRLLTLNETSRRTGRNAELLRRWCVSGRLRCERIGRDWMIDEEALVTIEGMPRRGKAKRGESISPTLGSCRAACGPRSTTASTTVKRCAR